MLKLQIITRNCEYTMDCLNIIFSLSTFNKWIVWESDIWQLEPEIKRTKLNKKITYISIVI